MLDTLNNFALRYFGNASLPALLFFSILAAAVVIVFCLWLKKQFPNKKFFRILSHRDLFLLLLITAVYAVFSLTGLGSFETANSAWEAERGNEYFILQVEEDNAAFDTILHMSGIGDTRKKDNEFQVSSEFQVYGSEDLQVWNLISEINTGTIYCWTATPVTQNYRYLKVVSESRENILNEIAFKAANEDRLLKISVYDSGNGSDDPHKVIDEQGKVPLTPNYFNSVYFDEVYHTRNAYEIANGLPMYYNVHPLLATTMISAGIKVFGMNPFGWRIMGALAGILILPLLYLLTKKVFKSTFLAAAGTFLMAVDFMHYTTSRIGTLEPFTVVFIIAMYALMYLFTESSPHLKLTKKNFWYLAGSGLMMSIGIACKWTVAYSAVGLALFFFLHCFNEWKRCKSEERSAFYSNMIKTFGWCVLFFVILPIVVYFAAYLPIYLYKGQGYSVENVWKHQVYMFNYHANLDAVHPFQTSWWRMPFMVTPMWYFFGNIPSAVPGAVSTISAFGNPVIWWTGIPAMLVMIYRMFFKKDKKAAFISLGYLAAYLPLVLISRIMFIYHYYPAMPFLILAIVYCIQLILKHWPQVKQGVYFFLITAGIAFLFFLPIISGFTTTREYVETFLTWSDHWYFLGS